MKRYTVLAVLVLAGCASSRTDVKRLSPVIGAEKIPAQCLVVSVVKDSPADKAGIGVGDALKSVNGQVPKDASVLSDIVAAAPQDSNFEVMKKDRTTANVKIRLSSSRPR